MNVEFQIHGVLSSGQKTWKQDDKDYYTQFYSGQSEDVLMIVEIVNRPHGVSSYYNYLRNNNILSTREGSYFGMTMRIDGGFCRDVKSIYMILDNLFNKMVVGSLLVSKVDKYEYIIDSFAAKNDYLLQIEKQFSNMLNAFCSPQDFFDISSANTSQGTKLSLNSSEITIPTVVETVKQRVKLYLSPTYQSKAVQKIIADTKTKADAAVADAQAKMKAVEEAHSQSKQRLTRDLDNWKKEKKELEEARDTAIKDYHELEKKVKKAELSTSINAKISEIKQPLIQLADLVAERFQEDAYGNVQEKSYVLNKDLKKNKLFVRLPWIICILLGIALAGAIWYMDRNKSDLVEQQARQMEQLEDSIKKMINSAGMGAQTEPNFKGEFSEEKEEIVYNPTKLRVNIVELPRGAAGLTLGAKYTCEITGGEFPKGGYWVIYEGDNKKQGNVFTVSSPSGTLVRITYCYGSDIIKERTIKVL